VSAFAALMVARANVLPEPCLTRAFERGVDFFLASQGADGARRDPPT
jgi:hypothetical protein